MNKKTKEIIFSRLIYNPKSTFSDLWDKSIPSNEFTYHLNKLIEEGYILKDENKRYSLTIKGKNFESELDGKSGKNRKKPFVAILLVIKKGDKFLLYHRLKEPFYDFYGMPGAKLDFGENILDCAKRELFEETGLVGDGKIINIANTKTFEDSVILSHFCQYIVLFEDPEGELINSSEEGEYDFVFKESFLEKYNQNKLFPDNLLFIENVEKFNGTINFYEIELYICKNKFVDFKSKKII